MSKRRRLIINGIILSAMLLLIAFFFIMKFYPFLRLWYSLKVFALDFANYFVVLFTGKSLHYSRVLDVLKLTPGLNIPDLIIPKASTNFWIRFNAYFKLLFNVNNLKLRSFYSLRYLILFLQAIQLFAIGIIFIRLYFSTYFELNFFPVTTVSKPLKFHYLLKEKVYIPLLKFVLDIYQSFISNKLYFWGTLVLAAIHLNFFTIILDTLGFVFYLTSTFDFISLYEFVYVTILNLIPMFKYIPFPIWLILAFILFRKWQYNYAVRRLYHFDSMNKGFLKSLGVVLTFKGNPRAGKTTMMIDAGYNFDEIFRNGFYDILKEFQAYFPDFPFSEYEAWIREQTLNGAIKNRHYIKVLVAKLFYDVSQGSTFLFTYNLSDQITHINLGNKIVFLEDALITYGEAFYYYSYNSSIIAGNLPVRYDFMLSDDNVHFPMWDYSSLTIDPYDSYERSRYSKNIDFDSFRMYKKIQYDIDHPGIDIGVLLESEAAKQWGNQYDNYEFKKSDEAANPLNDGFVDYLSTFSHSSLINYEPFIRYLMDYQRKGDMQSKIGELAETTINITSDAKKIIMTLPFFFYTPIVLEWLINFWNENYLKKYRLSRNDKTLLFSAINFLGSWATRYMARVSNKFLVTEKQLITNLGSEDSNITNTAKHSYYFIHKKIYANRFASDALKRYYDDGTNSSGFSALKDYAALYPSEQELLAQHSYFNNRRLAKKVQASKKDGPSVTPDGPLF